MSSLTKRSGSGGGGGGSSGGIGARLRSFDIYRKVPRDLTEASVVGGTISVFFSVFFFVLFVMEVNNFLAIKEVTSIEIDHSEDGIFQINFNITFPELSCEFISVDLKNVIGKKREDVNDKTIHKYSLDGSFQGFANDVEQTWEHLYEGTDKDHYGNVRHAIALDPKSFKRTLDQFEVTLIDFHAPWCVHCQNLAPVFQHAAEMVKQRAPHEVDGHHRYSVTLATVDCTVLENRGLCQSNHIQAFPTILVFRQSLNNVVTGPRGRNYESYYGKREAKDIADFAIKVLKEIQATDPEARQPQVGTGSDIDNDGKLDSKVHSRGCRIDGYMMVQRVPGQIIVRPKSSQHSLDTGFIKMDHYIKHLSFGNRKPTEVRKQVLSNMEGAYAEKIGKPVILAEKEDEVGFSSELANATFDHYIKVVSTTRIPRRGKQYHAYEYTINSNTHSSENNIPEVRISYDLSPLKVQVKEEAKPWIDGLTSMCAILGGVYTCSVLFEAIFGGFVRTVAKKLD